MSLNVSLHEKLLEAWGDAKTYRALHQEDWQMQMHSSGSTVSLSDMTDRWNIVFKNADIQNIRKIYENENILVRHFVADYPNGTKDPIIHVTLKKNGLMWRTETGVTPSPSKE